MTVQFLGCELSRWDDASGDALVVTFFRDERPLRGAAGLVDWRLCGRISRLIRAGHISGRAGESLLMPPGRRLPFKRLMIFGLGSAKGFDETVYRKHIRHIRDVVKRAGIQDFALQPPGRATGLVAARRALEMWIEESSDADENRVAIIDIPGAQKEMADILHARQRVSEKQKLESKAAEEAAADAAAQAAATTKPASSEAKAAKAVSASEPSEATPTKREAPATESDPDAGWDD